MCGISGPHPIAVKLGLIVLIYGWFLKYLLVKILCQIDVYFPVFLSSASRQNLANIVDIWNYQYYKLLEIICKSCLYLEVPRCNIPKPAQKKYNYIKKQQIVPVVS